MRLLALLAVAACGPVEPMPGELLVNDLSPSSYIATVAMRSDTIVWTSSLENTYGTTLHAAKTTNGPVDGSLRDLGGTDAVAVDGDKIYSAYDKTIYLVTDAKLTKIFTTPEAIRDLYVRTQDGAAELFWTSGDGVNWQGAHDVRATRVELPNSGVEDTQLAASADAVFLRTGSSLYRIDRETHVVSTFVNPSDFKLKFPKDLFIEDARPAPPTYHVQDVEIVGSTAYVLIWEENFIQDFSRGIVMAIPTTGGTPVQLVDTMWEPGRIWIDGDTIFWHEANSTPDIHRPSSDGGSALWTVRIDGGKPAYFMDSQRPIEIDGGYEYVEFGSEGQLSELRRIRLR